MLWSRRTCLITIAAGFVASRALAWAAGVRFDGEPVDFYWQYIDPALLRHDFWRSIFYLHQQPPIFNFYLGAILHLAPKHPEAAFHFTYLCAGLALSICLFALMDRMGVDRWIALMIALIYTLSPSTLLYENLLFYEYPLTALFCTAALFLHRYASGGRILDGGIFFSLLALISGIRSIYHLLWFVAIAVFVAVTLPKWTRRTMRAAAVPGILLLGFYVKHAIMFHNLIPGGEIYRGINLPVLTGNKLPPAIEDQMIAFGRISPVLKMDLFRFVKELDTDVAETSLAKFIQVPPKTGISVLDNCRKSTQEFNWNCVWARRVAELYAHDSVVVLRSYPRIYLHSVAENIQQYFLPDTEGWPFDGRTDDNNQAILSRPLAIYDLLTAGMWSPSWDRPWLFYVAFTALLGFGLFKIFRSGRERNNAPQAITLAFMIFNLVYLTILVILFSESDQNRYRSELSSYFAVLFGMAVTTGFKRWRG